MFSYFLLPHKSIADIDTYIRPPVWPPFNNDPLLFRIKINYTVSKHNNIFITFFVNLIKFHFWFLGHGWSEAASEAGLDGCQVGFIMHELMTRLGYTKYYIHGGGPGGLVAEQIAAIHPE